MTVLLRALVVLSALATALSGCANTGTDAAERDIRGIWLLEAYEDDGNRSSVEVGSNVARTPWIEIGDTLQGNGGCNDFGSGTPGPTVQGDLLIPGEVFATAAACLAAGDGPDLMEAERALLGALWEHPEGISFTVGGTGMIWVAGDRRLEFTSTLVAPVPPTSPPRTALGRLDCSPGTVFEDRVLDRGQDPDQLVIAASAEVVSVEFDPPFWWGSDEQGKVVAGVALGDIRPTPYHIYTCKPG